MTVTLNAGVPAAFTGETLPKAALVAASVNEGNKWYAWHLTAANAGAWVEMTGDTPVENNSYAVAIEFTTDTVSYKVGATQLLTAGESPSATLSNAAGLNIAAVGLAGYGSFGDFAAIGYEEFEVVVPAANVDAVKEAMQISEITSETLNTKGSNGLTVWESIVLGLESPSTKPYTAPVQTSGDALGFTIGNVDTAKYGATGATVTFDVYEYDIGEQTLGNKVTATSVAAGSTAEVTAPSGVKYYKIKIKITK